MSYRTRDQLLLAEIQAAVGTEETPTVSANAVRVRSLGYSPNFETLETNYVQSGLTQSEPVVGGGNVGMTFGAYLTGAGTPGEAPDYGPLLRGCGMAQTLTAAAVTGTAQAGGAASITLASAAVTADDVFKGMPIRLTGGTGSGQVAVITGADSDTDVVTVQPAWDTEPDATTTYSIDANALYRPVTSGLESITLWGYQNQKSGNSRRRRLYDGMGTFSLSLAPRGLPEIDFTFTGLMPGIPDDVTRPAEPSFGALAGPQPVLGAQSYLGDEPVKWSELSFDLGADVQMEDAVGTAYGYDSADIVQRTSQGRFVPNMVLTSSRDAFADWLASTERALWVRFGTAAGRRVSLWWPRIRYTGREETDVRGFAAEALPFRAVAPDGELYICVH